MLSLILIGLVTWSVALLFMAWHIWVAPEGFEDADGFHLVKVRPDPRWHHIQMRHHIRDHRNLRHTFAFATAGHRRH